jgi:hypothetical protein
VSLCQNKKRIDIKQKNIRKERDFIYYFLDTQLSIVPASHVIYVYTAAAVVVVVEDAIFLSERDMSNRPTETGAAFYRRDLLNEDQVSLPSIPKNFVCLYVLFFWACDSSNTI